MFVGIVLSASALPTGSLSPDNIDEPVGLSKFEAELIHLASQGIFELSFTPDDIRAILAGSHPYTKFDESDENIVLLDEFPYVPVVEIPSLNSTFIVSNLHIDENMDPRMIEVQFREGWQSLYFANIPMNASFDWRLNGSRTVSGRARLRIPNSWVHQNVEVSCSHGQPSLLSWEGRSNLYYEGVDIVTEIEDRAIIDGLANGIQNSKSLRNYISNAVQHQLAIFLGNIHWKSQFRMRDLCLQCHYMRYTNSSLVVALRGDVKCINSIPGLFFQGIQNSKATPADVQSVAVEAIARGMIRQFRPDRFTSDKLEAQSLGVVEAGRAIHLPINQLRPRVDPHASFHSTKSGFINEEPTGGEWAHKIGQLWMKWTHPSNKTV